MYKDEGVRSLMAIFQRTWFTDEQEEGNADSDNAEEGEEDGEGSYQVAWNSVAV